MNVLIVSQYFWPENFRINDLSAWLSDRGHSVTVLTGKPNYPGGKFFRGYGFFRRSRESFGAVDVIRVPLIPRAKGKPLSLILNYLSFAGFASLLGPLRIRGRYDVIFVYEPSPITVGLPALVMKKVLGAPVMLWVLDLWPESVTAAGAVDSPVLLKALRKLVGFIYCHTDAILVQSRAFLPNIRSFGIPDGRIDYMPSWADSGDSGGDVATAAPELSGEVQCFKIVFTGNIGVAQDFGAVLEAIQHANRRYNVHLYVYGSGRAQTTVEEAARRLGIEDNVHFMGRRPLTDMPAVYAGADALLVSLKSEPIFAMTIPAKLQSYLNAGKPVLGMIDGEAARVIEEAGAGLAAPAGNPELLAENIVQLAVADKAALEEMGRKGKAYYDRNFDRSLVLEKLERGMMALAASGRRQ